MAPQHLVGLDFRTDELSEAIGISPETIEWVAYQDKPIDVTTATELLRAIQSIWLASDE